MGGGTEEFIDLLDDDVEGGGVVGVVEGVEEDAAVGVGDVELLGGVSSDEDGKGLLDLV